MSDVANCVDRLLVGTGYSGAQVAIALRQPGSAGSIGNVGDEPEPLNGRSTA